MYKTILLAAFIGLLQLCPAPPVTEKRPVAPEHPINDSDIGGLEDYMEYHRYLKQVVNALESDPEFRQKLEKAEEHDIRSGKIADELQFVSHHVRTQLDEIKRLELVRLKELTEKKRILEEGLDTEDPTHHHLDHANPHTFEINDLKKLITKTTEDLAEADRKRRDEFKNYELQKEYEKLDKLNHTNGAEERDRLEHEFKEKDEKHKKHAPLHEPGHKAQLEEVWEEQDQMQQDFDPKTFFMLHDIDSNGLWDQNEVKALFVKELEKMYSAGAPEDDMREKVEEMERMRESVFREVDTNRDGFIDFQEFLSQTKSTDFKQDHGWQGLDEQKPYTDEELQEYIRMHQAGYYPNQPPPGYYQAHPAQFQGQYPPQHIPGRPDLNTNEIYPPHPGAQGQNYPPQAGYPNQQHPNQIPPQGYQGGYPNQVPQQGGYQNMQNPNQVPQQQRGYQNQQHPNQIPLNQQGAYQNQQHPNQVPQQQAGYQNQQHPNQIPQNQQHLNQIPQQQGGYKNPQYPNQVPQNQQHQNQVPQQQGGYQNQQLPKQIPQQQQGGFQNQQHPEQVAQQGAPQAQQAQANQGAAQTQQNLNPVAGQPISNQAPQQAQPVANAVPDQGPPQTHDEQNRLLNQVPKQANKV